MEAGIERLAALVLILTGLSHVAAPGAWARLFVAMRGLGAAAGLLNAYIHAPLGLLIVAFHPVWSGCGLIVTLIGCALLLKGTLYFVRPQMALRSLAHVDEARTAGFRAGGVAGLLLGALCAWVAWG